LKDKIIIKFKKLEALEALIFKKNTISSSILKNDKSYVKILVYWTTNKFFQLIKKLKTNWNNLSNIAELSTHLMFLW